MALPLLWDLQFLFILQKISNGTSEVLHPSLMSHLPGSFLLHKHRFYSITHPAPLLEAEKHVQPLTHRHTAFSEWQ